jgi:hypothetical protein
MDEIIFQVVPSEDSSLLVASWDDPQGGGITTQGRDLRELQEQISDAVPCHFGTAAMPKRIRFHFTADPVLTTS